MKRELTVVFPIFIDTTYPRGSGGKFWILMGRQAPGKRLAGIRNGYGGKCEAGELPIDCAVREVKEEIALDLEKEKLIYIGLEIENEKKIYFYAYIFPEKIKIEDNGEFVDNKWFLIKNYDEYVQEMFPGNIIIAQSVLKVLEDPNCTPFEVNLSDNKDLVEVAKKIYD